MKKNRARRATRWGSALVVLILIAVMSLLIGGCGADEPASETGSNSNAGTTIVAGGDKSESTEALDQTQPDDGDPLSQDQPSVVTLGIDVSKWQGKIDWEQVAAAGVDFAIVRVGFRTTDTGEINEDPYAAYNLQYAAEAGIQLGAYFFSTAVTEEEAREEALWTVDYLAGYPITYPVAYNCEGFLSEDSRMYGTTTGQRTRHALAFLQTVEDAGYEAIFHASKYDLTDGVSWDTAQIEAEFPVWVAQYPAEPYPATERSTYYGAHTMWQYTSQGTVPGIDAHVDVNVAYFAYEETAAPKDPGAAGEAEDVPIDSTFQDVDELVTAKDVTNLRTEPSSVADETVAAQLQRGEWVVRTGVSSKGWSRVEYNGQTLYAVTSLLLTEEEYQQEEREQENQSETGSSDEPATEPPVTVTYEPASDRVTAKVETNLRNAAGTEGTQVIATIRNGQWVTRTGIGSNGWSRLDYNGQTVYALTSYLTTDENYDPGDVDDRNIVWTETSDAMTAKDTTNLRDKPTTDGSQVIATIRHGDIVQRIAIGSNGWSRVVYNGQTLYAVTSLLTEAQ